MDTKTHFNHVMNLLTMFCVLLVTGVGAVHGYQDTARMQRSNQQDIGDRYTRYAKALLRSYDSDKDGNLDTSEISKMRRPIQNADADGDGEVTVEEIVLELESRTKDRAQRDQGRTGGSVSRAGKYADELIKQYDTNSDGSLDKQELSKMRRPPRADADVDADGTVSRKELVDAILNRKQTQALSKLLGGISGDVLGGGGIDYGSVLANSNAKRDPESDNNKASKTRIARVNFHLLQLNDNINPSKLNELAEKISRSDQESVWSLLKEMGEEEVLTNDQVYATLRPDRQFRYQNGGNELQITARRARQDGALFYDTREVDVGFELSLVPEFDGDRIRLEVEVNKSFIDMYAKPAPDSGVKLQPIRIFQLETEFSFVNHGAAASVLSGSGRQWLVVVTGQFE